MLFLKLTNSLYCCYDFWVSAWRSEHEVFENAELDQLASLNFFRNNRHGETIVERFGFVKMNDEMELSEHRVV